MLSALTKIICTIGPAVQSYEKILELIDNGMNVARLNFSHGTHDQHKNTITILKKARKERGVPLAILLDTKGPEIRLGKVPDGHLEVHPQTELFLTRKKELQGIEMTPEAVFDALEVGTILLFADGYISSKVLEKTSNGIRIQIQNKGVLKDQSGVNIPNVYVPFPAMTQEDRASITLGVQEGVDLIAASFIRSRENILEIKELLHRLGNLSIAVIAKIEDIQGVRNFDQILEVADGIMVARGDLGVELPLYEVPSLQKMMIRKSYRNAKPVITATQMLESMIHNPRPTRAEVSDVANAIYDSTSAVMLSGETAMGLYPIETVKIMKRIIQEAEKQFNYRDFFYQDSREEFCDISFSVALAAVKTAYCIGAKAIFALTNTGSTARLISRFRPEIPVFALSPTLESYHQMALLWGVISVDPHRVNNVEEALTWMSQFVKKYQYLQAGDTILITAGSPFGITGTTNMMIVSKVE